MKFIHFNRTRLSFKAKLLQRNGTQFSLLANLDISPTMTDLFRESHVCFSRKHFMKSIHLQKNVISFQSNASTEKKNTVLIQTILWHITNNIGSFQGNTCAFVTKAFHEIIQSKASTENRNTVLILKILWDITNSGL